MLFEQTNDSRPMFTPTAHKHDTKTKTITHLRSILLGNVVQMVLQVVEVHIRQS